MSSSGETPFESRGLGGVFCRAAIWERSASFSVRSLPSCLDRKTAAKVATNAQAPIPKVDLETGITDCLNAKLTGAGLTAPEMKNRPLARRPVQWPRWAIMAGRPKPLHCAVAEASDIRDTAAALDASMTSTKRL
jgi:hypothetical protein